MPRFALVLFASLFMGLPLDAQPLSVFESFTNHAVLQRNAEHPVWGWARPGRKVKVTMGEISLSAKADRDGRWEVTLPAQPAGGPHRIVIAAGRESVTLEDVYFGDVYLLSGQSNMEWRLAQSDSAGTRARAIADPLIRELKVQKAYANVPEVHLPVDMQYGEEWLLGSEEMGNFSGVGSYFAHYLRKEVDVPIGLVHASWGGSRIEPWLSAETLGRDVETVLAEREDMLATAGKEGAANFKRNFPGRELPKEDAGEKMGWLAEDHDDTDWPTMTLPTFWEAAGYPSVDGYFYFRGTFELTAEQAAGPVTLYLGAIDDGDWTHVNGQLVGATPNAYSEPRVYEIEPGVLRAGTNKIAMRIFDGQGGGGFSAGPDAFYAETATGKVSLAGDYKYNIGEFRVDAQPNQVPTILYNAMIAPLKGLPVSGVLWYQGESNAGNGDNVAYAEMMKKLVTSWRAYFKDEDLPFYWVQLANFLDPPNSANEPGWAVIRASQTAATELPRTGMAVITDIGEADDIHPRNKWEVGRRLSLFALRDIYGRKVEAESPSVRDTDLKGSLVKVTFRNIGEGLTVRSDGRYPTVSGFTVRDAATGAWHFAPGILDAGRSEVFLTNPTGGKLDAVRYNWASNPDGNLFSKEGLPVDGFEVELKD